MQQPTDDLLRRMARDYRQLHHDWNELSGTVERLEQRAAELEQEVEELRGALAEKRNPDELARAALAAAQRTVRELREEARSEAELTLKKARARGAEIEQRLERERQGSMAQVRELEELKARLREQLRTSLEAALAAIDNRAVNGGQQPSLPPENKAEAEDRQRRAIEER